MSYIDTMKLALAALNTTESDCGSRAWEREQEAITALREALAEQPAQGCNYCNHALYSGTKCKNCGREAAPVQRCALCNYQHGHAIGCKNNPVDIALNKKADNARELGLDYEPVLKDNSNYRYDPPFAEPVATLFGSLPVYDTTPPAQPAPVPLTDWVSVDDRLPESGGYYLVTVDTDEGPHVDVIMYNAKRKHWEHEGEPTFCHSYLFSPTHWAARPEAAQSITKGQS